MISAVEAMHQQRLLHRDIKPDNSRFKGNQLKIIDFGITKEIPTSDMARSGFFGTRIYASLNTIKGF